ncbi:MAG: metallophosphoesterase family protein [Lachnospiraceae bacterium]|nr:metallophosphoesterase family protein [Lachnospiraceae bacterium]
MRILAVSDKESPYYWDFFEKSKLEGIDLILSCGDLDPHYLSFLATFTSSPVLYVHGNHDEKYVNVPPEGCISIDDKIYVHNGIRILGLGGSMKYCDDKLYQYTEKQMRKRVQKLRFQLLRRKGFDILLTHSPAFGLNDGKDLPQRGFQIFTDLMEKYKPRFHLHGHVHLNYGREFRRYLKHGETHIINAYERVVFDYEDDNPGRELR